MLYLYHAETAVCAAKVRLVLAEKELPWEGRLIDLQAGEQFDPGYLKLNPNAVVPTLVHGDVVLIESTVINEYLDDTFDARPLMPATAAGRARVHLWTKREDSVHDVINTLTAALVFRADLLRKPPEERARRYDKMPDPARREKWRELLVNGVESGVVRDALVRLARHCRAMESALGSGAWLAGPSFTLADAGLVSFFARLEMLHCDRLWQQHFPRVTSWVERCTARPSFEPAVGQYLTAPRRAHYTASAAPLAGEIQARFAAAMAA